MLRSICYRIRCICLHHELFQCIVSILPTNKERSAHQSWQLKWQGYAELTGTEAQVESNLETVQGSLLWVIRLSMKIMTMKTTRTRPRCWDMRLAQCTSIWQLVVVQEISIMSPQIRLVLVSDAMQKYEDFVAKSHRHHNPLGACESLGRKLRFSTVRFSVWFPEVGIAHGEGVYLLC